MGILGAMLLGSLISAGASAGMSAWDKAYNSREAEKNRDWQEYMSNTAYQRQVLDMQEAGLNPYLSLSAGGASTPSGASASHTSSLPQMASFVNTILNAQTARDLIKQRANQRKIGFV